MATDSEPDQIVQQEFGHALRGYDQRQVRAYLEALASRMSALLRETADLRSQIGEMDDQALEDHIDVTAAEVANVLHTARLAAQSLEARSSDEIAATRSAAAETIGSSLRAAEADAYRLRKAAWETSSQMLDQVRQTARAGRKKAEKDTLGIIGEAERSAHRKVAEATREAESRARGSRLEAEKLLVEARARRDQMLDQAERATDAAQERVLALERRRDELMHDLESIRADTLEASKEESVVREDFTGATVRVVPASVEPSSEPRRVEPPDQGSMSSASARWADGSDTVRVIPPSSDPIIPPPAADMDPDTLVDELTGGGRDKADEEIGELIDLDDLVVFGGDPEIGAGDDEEAEPSKTFQGQDQTDEDDLESAESAPLEDETISEDEIAANENVPVPPRPEIPAASGSDTQGDELGTLFDLLRDPADGSPSNAPAPKSDNEISEETAVEDLIAPEQPDPLELRDRSLLPAMNRALRAVKRALSEIQNGQMEQLKDDLEAFESEEGSLAALVDPELLILVREAHVAGVEAAATLARADDLDRSGIERPAAIDVGFAQDAHAAVVEAIDAEKAAGSGVGEVTAAVSKIYRVWRADEAERRLRHLAFQHFHEGMVAGLTLTEVSEVTIEITGAGCEACEAATGVFELDSLEALPPFHDDCRCVLSFA